MAKYLEITPGNINPEQHKIILDTFENNGVIAYPTDSGYALGCKAGSSKAQDRIKKIREFDSHHNFTLMCRDLSEISQYAKVNTPTYRILKKYSPGAFTFVLPALCWPMGLLLMMSQWPDLIHQMNHLILLIAHLLSDKMASLIS